jgi:hypothetical protein
MAAVAQLQAVKQPPFFLKATLPFEDYMSVRISYTSTISGNEVTRKQGNEVLSSSNQ